MAYNLTLNNQQLQLSLARTGGQGSQGNSVTSASIDSNGDFHIIISNASGQQVQDINLGGATIIAEAIAAKNAAEAALDTFDDRFLGVKSSAPGLDNDNDALVTGALYFDSTISHLGVYNGSTWVYPLQAAQTSATAAAASETAAATSETNAGTSETNAATSATNAANSAAQAASSESTVAASATTASTAATNALASQSAAATSEANAGTSETNAATSETNAGNSATAAAASGVYANNRATAAAASAAAALVSENNSATSESSAASSATTAGIHSTNAAANAVSANNSKTAAASSETNALNYQSGAQTAETNAATSETNAASSATAAATSATNSATSATASASSASAAQTAQAATELVFDNFDDKFLGTKTSDPTVDNDGNALVEGSMYYNSTDNVIKFYSGSAWQAPSVTATNAATSATTSATNASTSATNAATSETNAAASAASSLTSANNAAASYDSFDDRYLGSKSSAPTTDNDGNSLLTGALYWNSTLDKMYVYTGAIWTVATGSIPGIKMEFVYTATAGQTAFTGSDDNSETLVMDDTKLVDVFLNGIRLVKGTDYTLNLVTDTVTFASGRTVNDMVVVQVFGNLAAAGLSISGANLTGGTINNAVIGGTTPAAGSFTTITATGTIDGRDVAADGTKIDGIETGATADQTASEIKTAYESNSDTNAFTDALQTKLNGIEASADVTDTANVTAAGALMTTGGSVTGNVSFGDNDKAIFGAGSDLQIYHNGINSLIADSGTGGITLRSNLLSFQNAAGTETLAQFIEDGGVILRHNNVTKLSTAATGVSITGGFAATDTSTITVDDNSVALNLVSTDTDASQGPVFRLTRDATGAASDTIGSIQFYGEDAGGNATEYVELQAQIDDATDGSEDGKFEIRAVRAGTARAIMVAKATETVFNDGSQDIDFRVESNNNANMLFVDGGNNRVGVGTNAPNGLVELRAGDGSGTLNIVSTVNATNSGNKIAFFAADRSDTDEEMAYIKPLLVTNNGGAGNIQQGHLTFGTSGNEAMRIDSSGNVGIGVVPKTGGSTWQHVQFGGTGNLLSRISDTTVDAMFASNYYVNASGTDSYITTGAAARMFLNDSTISFDQAASGTAGTAISWSEAMRIDANGNVGIGTNSPATALSVVGTSTFTKANNDANIILETTDADADAGPLLDFYRNPGQAGADGDLIGRIEFNGLNDASEKTLFATIFSTITDASDGSEDGSLRIKTMREGTARDRITMNASETIINDGGMDLDFRVESDTDTHAFFIDGADGNIGMSVSNPSGHIPTSHNIGKRSFVIHEAGGSQFVASRSDTTTALGNYVGGYLFKTNDNSVNKFGGMICTADDTAGNANLEFYPVSNSYESSNEGSMQLDDSGDLYLRGGGIRVGRSHGGVTTTAEESVIIYSGGVSNTQVRIQGRDGTGGDPVFLYERLGTTKAEIEENGDFLSATNSYGSTSDQRLKENIVASGSQWDDIKSLQIKKYSMIEDGLDAPNMLGVMAQDLQASGMNGLVKQHFKMDEEDNPILDADGNQEEFLSVKYSVLYMKAIKALQEAMAKIEILETKVAALEAE